MCRCRSQNPTFWRCKCSPVTDDTYCIGTSSKVAKMHAMSCRVPGWLRHRERKSFRFAALQTTSGQNMLPQRFFQRGGTAQQYIATEKLLPSPTATALQQYTTCKIRFTSPGCFAAQRSALSTHHRNARVEEELNSLVMDGFGRQVDRRTQLELGQERKTCHL